MQQIPPPFVGPALPAAVGHGIIAPQGLTDTAWLLQTATEWWDSDDLSAGAQTWTGKIGAYVLTMGATTGAAADDPTVIPGSNPPRVEFDGTDDYAFLEPLPAALTPSIDSNTGQFTFIIRALRSVDATDESIHGFYTGVTDTASKLRAGFNTSNRVTSFIDGPGAGGTTTSNTTDTLAVGEEVILAYVIDEATVTLRTSIDGGATVNTSGTRASDTYSLDALVLGEIPGTHQVSQTYDFLIFKDVALSQADFERVVAALRSDIAPTEQWILDTAAMWWDEADLSASSQTWVDRIAGEELIFGTTTSVESTDPTVNVGSPNYVAMDGVDDVWTYAGNFADIRPPIVSGETGTILVLVKSAGSTVTRYGAHWWFNTGLPASDQDGVGMVLSSSSNIRAQVTDSSVSSTIDSGDTHTTNDVVLIALIADGSNITIKSIKNGGAVTTGVTTAPQPTAPWVPTRIAIGGSAPPTFAGEASNLIVFNGHQLTDSELSEVYTELMP